LKTKTPSLFIKGGILFLYLFLFSTNSNAQIGNVWTFGYKCGLDFNYEPPRMLNPSPKLFAKGNCATICNDQGNLLYYSDGENIWNRKHEIIKNGDGIFGASYTLGQSSIFFPSKNKDYYFFHGQLTHINDALGLGLFYSVINSDGDSVTKKNIRIDSGCYYSLIALKHANNKDYWLLARKIPDTFVIIHYTGSGITSIKKQHFNKPFTPYYYNTKTLIGTAINLCPSNDGKSILETYWYTDYFFYDSSLQKTVFKETTQLNIYDFDNVNGRITRKRNIEFHETDNYVRNSKLCSPVFSPNDSLFYILDKRDENGYYKYYQYERYAENISDSKTVFLKSNKGNRLLTAMKLAPNGKIYISENQFPYVSEIPYPNRKGEASGFKDRYIKTKKNDSFFAVANTLPNTYFQYINLNLKHKRCGSPYNFISYYDTTVFKYFTWYFEGGDSAVGADVNYHFPKTGRYFVKLKGISENGYCQWYSDSITYIKPPQANFSFDSKQGCQWIGFNFYDSSTTDTIHPTKGQSWLWDFGDGTFDTAQNPTHVFTKTGFYNVKLIYSNGFCEDSIIKTQSIEIIAAPKPGFTVNESQYCTPFDLKITDQSVGDVLDYLYTTSNGLSSIQPNPVFRFNQPGAYKIVQTLTGPTGCITKDSTTIHLTKGFDSLEIINILTATVNPQEFIEVSWEKHPTAINYQVYRNGKELTQIVGNTFNDSGVDVHNSVYSYKVAGLDSCGSFSQNSLPVKNILLNGESQGNEFCIVRWTAFEQWQSGVESYVVEKKDSTGNFVNQGCE
jgi:PKD repeat protein